MAYKLQYNTISPRLHKILNELMQAKQLQSFRLVGGTALSLYLGHRKSVDIDLFTDQAYGSIDFQAIHNFLKRKFAYVESLDMNLIGMGKSYYIGTSAQRCIKLDLYYTDSYIDDPVFCDGIRLASIDEIVAMKLDVVQRGGRKKDFWDIHELTNTYSFKHMLELHQKRYPNTHDKKTLKKNFIQFELADDDFDPICLRHKYWEIIKLDLTDFVK
jgi:predicted nucleotidyltransferase component of viral defense system